MLSDDRQMSKDIQSSLAFLQETLPSRTARLDFEGDIMAMQCVVIRREDLRRRIVMSDFVRRLQYWQVRDEVR